MIYNREDRTGAVRDLIYMNKKVVGYNRRIKVETNTLTFIMFRQRTVAPRVLKIGIIRIVEVARLLVFSP